jgi:hypothetical protein
MVPDALFDRLEFLQADPGQIPETALWLIAQFFRAVSFK